jgi:hypothetical protein
MRLRAAERSPHRGVRFHQARSQPDLLLLDSEVPYLKTETPKSTMLQGLVLVRSAIYDAKRIHQRTPTSSPFRMLRLFAVLKTRSEQKIARFPEEACGKKVFHKSTAPLAAGVKQEILTQACNSEVTQIRPREAHQSRFSRRKHGIQSSRRHDYCYMKFLSFPLTW